MLDQEFQPNRKSKVCNRNNRGQVNRQEGIYTSNTVPRQTGMGGNKGGEMFLLLQNDTITTAPSRFFTGVLAIIATGGITGAAHESGTSSLLLLKVRLAVNRMDEYNDKHN